MLEKVEIVNLLEETEALLSWGTGRVEYIPKHIKLFADGVIEREITGAWAGEIGQVQMLPSDILIYGADGDGDGIVNLKKSSPDAILTAAALISSMGWRSNQPWIDEVVLPEGFLWEKAGFGRGRTLGEWKSLGVKLSLIHI